METVDDARQASIQRALAVLTPEEKSRLNHAQTRLEVALAREYGADLADSTVKNLIDGLVIEPEALTNIFGSAIDELPSDSPGWSNYCRELVKRDPAAQSDVAHANQTAIAAYKQDALSNLNPQQKMNWARNGTLDSYLSGKATEALANDLAARRGV